MYLKILILSIYLVKNSLTNEFKDSSMELMKNSIEYTKQFNTKKLTLHLGSVNKDEDRSEYVSAIIPTLQELCDYANQYNMNVIDAGVAVLSMHAPWEVTSQADVYETYRGYKAFLEEM